MSEHLIHDPDPWTAEEDDILIACWQDPNIDVADITELLPGFRTREAIQQRSHEIELGEKAQKQKRKRSRKNSTAWPDDMPNFEDHPRAAAPGSSTRAVLLGSRLKSLQTEDSSLTGSTLQGASPEGLQIDE